jgi:YegS/Rv2252/BmrU family lipid kinase
MGQKIQGGIGVNNLDKAATGYRLPVAGSREGYFRLPLPIDSSTNLFYLVSPPIRRVLLIANPGARRGERALPKAVRAFADAGVHCDAITTESPGHGAQLALDMASNYDAVFTLGGDGTAIEVMGALAHAGPPVGVLPGGTANVVARTLGVPTNVGRAVRRLLEGDEARIDLGRLSTGQRFAVGMGVGLDATTIALAPSGLKRRLGFIAYLISASRAVAKLEQFDIRLVVDGEVIEKRAAVVLILNIGAIMNELITFGDGIRRDDGYLNACIYSPLNHRDAARIVWKLIRKNFSPDPCITYRRGSDFRVTTNPPTVGQADGELLGTAPFHIVVEPLAGRVLVPRR